MATRKVKFDFNPLKGIRITSETKKRAILNEVKEFVLDSVLADVGEGRSPVTGSRFKALSKDYKEFKRGKGATIPNLELEGDLLDSLTVDINDKGTLTITVSDDQQPKADGHNNFSGKSRIPRRPFIPDAKRDEDFRPKIRSGIKQIVEDELLDV